MASMKMELSPFAVPTGVYAQGKPRPRQEGFKTPTEIPLSDLDDETLNELLAEFAQSVLIKARGGVKASLYQVEVKFALAPNAVDEG